MNRQFHTLILVAIFFTSFAYTAKGVASNEGVSTIVFMRSSLVGAAVKASIYEVTNGKTIFIGIMKNKTKIEYQATAGKHTFMVVAESADFMEADIVAGKTYYSMITPRTGAWKARFSMIPVRNDGTTEFNTDSEEFKKWVEKTKPVSVDETQVDWYQKHKDSVEDKRVKYWQKWLQKSPVELLERTLNPDDGL